MKLNRKILIKGLSVGMEIGSFFMKKELSRYTITVTDVVDAGKDSGMVILSIIDALKDRKLSPEETLEVLLKERDDLVESQRSDHPIQFNFGSERAATHIVSVHGMLDWLRRSNDKS